MPRVDYRRAAVALVLASCLSAASLSAFPQVDLVVSGWFYTPQAGFRMSGNHVVEATRDGIWNLSIAAFALSIAGLFCVLIRRPLPGLGARVAGFIFLLYLLGPILLVNGVLKAHWGRARPVNVAEFGGDATFTPPLVPADQCVSNCSFVSGEGAAAAALALTFLVLAPAARRMLPRFGYAAYVAAGVVLPMVGLALRIVTGRHFFSDTVFAVLLVLAIGLALHRLLLRSD